MIKIVTTVFDQENLNKLASLSQKKYTHIRRRGNQNSFNILLKIKLILELIILVNVL